MTVVTAIITRICTVHASDSFITVPTGDGRFDVAESQETKVVRVPRVAGIIAYWGLATYPGFGWNTLEWLRQRAKEADQFGSAEDFAQFLNDRLNAELSRMNVLNRPDAGIGLHFTAYEDTDSRSVPELFRISNFVDTGYNSVFPDGFHCTRETYNQLTEDKASLPDHCEPSYRLQVYESLLHQDAMFIYNNGDPLLFNPVAQALLDSFRVIRMRGALRNADLVETYRDLAKSAIDIVCDIQEKFVQEERIPAQGEPRRFVLRGQRKIGGRRHALAVTAGGDYLPLTGD